MRTLKLLGAVGLVVLILAGCFLLPCATEPIRETLPIHVSGNNLKQIALAMHSYHDTHKKLPPAVIRAPNGKPLYSWRVAMLPFLEQDALYKRFKLDEPWDSAHNRKLLAERPAFYAISWPETLPGMTPYQVFTGPGTAFERDGLTLQHDFPDGTSNTMLVVEASDAVPWTKPSDLVYNPNGPLPPLGAGLGLPSRVLCYRVGQQPGFNVCLADASVRFVLNRSIDERMLRGIITRNGGEDDVNREWNR
jgi:hypothetical protein